MTSNDVINLEDLIKERIIELARRLGEKLRDETIKVIEDNKVQATGDLKGSIHYDIEDQKNMIIMTVSSNVYYALYVHEGTRPHYPPIWKIRDWVKKKGLASRLITKGNNKGKFKQVLSYKNMKDYWEVDQVARAIARKIARKGTKGIKFFEIALRNATPKIEQMIREFKV